MGKCPTIIDTEGNRPSAIIYPDGVSLKYTRNNLGQLTRAECRDGAFEYVWNDAWHIQEIQYHSSNGVWSLKPGEKWRKLKLQFYEQSSSPNRSVASALGSWRFDALGTLCEMFVSGGERLVKRTGVEDSEMVSWSSNGQTTYRFDKAGTVMSVFNSDGTNAVFKRLLSDSSVLFMTSSGVGILTYNDTGRLVSDRDQHGQGASYYYNSRGDLNKVYSLNQTLTILWNDNGFLSSLSSEKNLRVLITNNNGIPDHILFEYVNLPILDIINLFVEIVWNWQIMVPARRLTDSKFNRL